MNYPISDLCNRLNNARLAGLKDVSVPYSNYKALIIDALKKEGFVATFKNRKSEGIIEIKLDDGCRQFEKIKVVSKPSGRVYAKKGRIPRSRGGFGTVILSTPQGLMNDTQARKKGIGGEVIFEVY